MQDIKYVAPVKENGVCDVDFLLSRHSVRIYKRESISSEDIKYAIECFINSPTACNRQMCKVYQICSSELISLLNSTLHGIGGFDLESITHFVITFDIAAIASSAERNQGYLNAGLCAMNFVNASY